MTTHADTSERGQLRVSYVWRDEVMSDAVLVDSRPITLGPTQKATFTIPALGLPEKYAILRPSRKGYLLTLGVGMTGRLRIGGQETEVKSFLEGGGGEAEGNFRATRVGPGDWGVIHLDGHGEHTFFFQFVKPDPPLPRSRWQDSELLLPAYAFAIVLISIFVGVSFWFRDGRNSMVFPGERQLAMDYITERPPPPPEEPKEEKNPMAGLEDAKEKEPSSTTGDPGQAGGEGDKPRKRDPNPDKGDPADKLPTIRRGLLTDNSRATLRRSQGGFDKKLGDALARMQGTKMDGSLAGYGKGKGTGVGLGVGTGTLLKGGKGGSGGGGNAQGDFVTQGAIKTGGGAPRGVSGGTGVKAVAVEVQTGTPSGELGGLTHAEIMKVVRSRRRAIQACYERQLQRVKGLSGKIVVRWKINAAGQVMGPKVATTSMRNGGVEDCIVRQVQSMKFPSPRNGTIAVVNFPFIFAPR